MRSIVMGFVALGLWLLTLLMLPATVTGQSARILYVTPAGADTENCLTVTTACQTISAAIDKAQAGDMVRVATGTYYFKLNPANPDNRYIFLIFKSITLSGGWNETFSAQTGFSVADAQDIGVIGYIAARDANGNRVAAQIERFILQNSNPGPNYAGALYVDGDLVLNNSTVRYNRAGGCGGLCVYGSIDLNNVTMQYNSAVNDGGAIAIGQGARATIRNSTIVRNQAGGRGGGILAQTGAMVNLQNTILAENTAGVSGADCSGPVVSSGYNLVGATAGCAMTPGPGDLNGANARLLPTAYWLGYFALGPDSPAIDSGNPTGCIDAQGNPLAADQRNAPRYGRCDIGAYEYRPPGPAAQITTARGSWQSATVSSLFQEPLVAGVTDALGTPLAEGTAVTFQAPAFGASGVFTDTNSAATVVMTSADGVAIATPFRANLLTGDFSVTAHAEGVSSPAAFHLTNLPWQPAGHFETAMMPPSNTLHIASPTTLFLVGDTVNRSSDGGHMWHTVLDSYRFEYATRLAASPSFDQDGIVFFGSPFTLLRSSHGGVDWRAPQQPVSGPITQIAVSPAFTADRTVFVATASSNGQFVLRSSDGGERWQNVTPPNSAPAGGLVLSPGFAADQTVFIWTGEGRVLRSIDRGATWTTTSNGLGMDSGNRMRSLVISPDFARDRRLVAATDQGVFATTNSGQTWQQISTAPIRTLYSSLDANRPNMLFGLYEERIGSTSLHTLLRSLDGGANWNPVWTNYPGVGCFPFNRTTAAVSPEFAEDDTIYLDTACGPLLVSYDAGSTWYYAQPGNGTNAVDTPADAPPITWNKLVMSPDFERDRLVFGYYGESPSLGLAVRSEDGGFSWATIQLPLATYQLAFSPTFAVDRTLFAASENGLFRSIDRGDNWQVVTAQLPMRGILTISPAFATDRTMLIRGWNGSVFRSTNGGVSWQLVSPCSQTSIRQIELSPGYSQDQTIFVVSDGGILYRSPNSGVTCQPVNTPGGVGQFAVSPTYQQDRTLILLGNRIWRSADDGATWVDITPTAPTAYPVGVAMSPKYTFDQTIILQYQAAPLYMSENAGATWFPLRGLPPVLHPSQTYGLAIGYEEGLLMPLATVETGIYRYRWPSIWVDPISIGVASGTQPRLTIPVPLAADDYAAVPWSLEPTGSWPLVQPSSGMLPATATLTIDAATSGVPAQTELRLTARWSQRQKQELIIPLSLWEMHPQYFPIIRRSR